MSKNGLILPVARKAQLSKLNSFKNCGISATTSNIIDKVFLTIVFNQYVILMRKTERPYIRSATKRIWYYVYVLHATFLVTPS